MVVDKHPSVYNREMLYFVPSGFSTNDTHFHGMVFILLAVLDYGVEKRIKFFDVHVISLSLNSFLYKSLYTITRICYNIDHIYNISPFLISHNVCDH